MKSLFKTVAYITIFSVVTRAMGFVFRIYLSRALGPEALGLYQVALSVFSVLLTVVASGMPVVISKLTAKYYAKKDKNSEGSLVTAALLISVVTSLVLILLVLAFKSVFSAIFADDRCYTILLVLLPAILCSAIYNVFRGAMWGHSNYFPYCITELFEQISRIIICVFLLTFGLTSLSPSISAALSLSIASLLSAGLAVVLYFVYGGRMKKPNGVYKEVLRSNTSITGVRVASSLVQPIIALIVPARLMAAGYTSAQAMSSFGVAMGMTMPLLFIPVTLVGSLSMVLIPDLSTALANKDGEHVKGRIFSSITFALLITFLLIPLYIGAGENIGLFFYDNAESGRLLASAAWIMLPFALLNITSAILNALGLEVKSFVNYLIGSIFMFAGIIFLPQFIGVRAIVWGMGLCVTVAALLNIRMIKKHTNVKLNILKPTIKLSLISLPTAALTYFVSSLLSGLIPLFFNLAISCLLGLGMFVLLAVIFGVLNIQVMFVEFKKIIKSKSSKYKKSVKN